jgi:hypothetical protein
LRLQRLAVELRLGIRIDLAGARVEAVSITGVTPVILPPVRVTWSSSSP